MISFTFNCWSNVTLLHRSIFFYNFFVASAEGNDRKQNVKKVVLTNLPRSESCLCCWAPWCGIFWILTCTRSWQTCWRCPATRSYRWHRKNTYSVWKQYNGQQEGLHCVQFLFIFFLLFLSGILYVYFFFILVAKLMSLYSLFLISYAIFSFYFFFAHKTRSI